MDILRTTGLSVKAWRAGALLALLLVALVFTPPPPFVEANSPPAAPGAVTVTRANGTITASGYSVSNATKYHITYSTDNGKSWHAPVEGHTNITTRSLTFKADNAKSYIVGARAGNADGWSGWRNSPPVGPYTPPKPTPTPTPTPAPTPAPAPTLTAARSNDGNAASVSWTAYSGDNFQYYRVIVCDDSQYDGSSCSGTVFKSDPIYDANSTGPVTVTGLDAGTGYGVILQVWRGGSALKIHATLPAVPPVGPDAPANLSVTPGDGYLDIAWDAVSGATGYDVRAKKAGASDWHDVASNITTTSHRYTTTETMDYVAVRARNANGVSAWSEISRLPSSDWLNVVIQGGASSASAQSQNQLAAPASVTITRENHPRDEKLYLTWATVSGADGYNLACAASPNNAPMSSWSWWHCGSVDSGSTTTFTVDEDRRRGLRRDLGKTRSYAVAVRAVTSNPAQASPWLMSADAHPAYAPDRETFSVSRATGSVSVSWARPDYAQGYKIYCATYENNAPGTYTLCANVANATAVDGRYSATISSWTADSTNYTIDDAKSYVFSISTTNTWGESYGTSTFEIYPLDTLTVSNLGVTTATLNIANYSGNWYYKADASPDTTCQGPVSGSTKDLTDLNAHTNYIYSAYSDSACSVSRLIDAAPQFTTLSSISNLSSTKSGDSDIFDGYKQAVAFTAGPNSGGYTLKSVTIPLRNPTNTRGLTMTLHAMEGSGKYTSSSAPSDTVLATLSGTEPTSVSWTDTNYTCSGSGCNLSSGKTYFVVATGENVITNKFFWAYASTETETALPSGNGWSVGFDHYKDGTRAWASWSTWNIAEIVFATK